MPKTDDLYLLHMLDMAIKVLELADGVSYDDYEEDETLRLALTHLLQNLGEAARRVSRDFQSSHPEILWAKIVGMRHKIVHDYLEVDEDVVWVTLKNDLVPLIDSLRRITDTLDKRPLGGNGA